jgi:hypothetical protein
MDEESFEAWSSLGYKKSKRMIPKGKNKRKLRN